jgi:NADH:ubiquinone oxidoreductase subunit 3 (subunit A)
MLESYFPVLVFILFAAAFGFIPIVAGWVLGPSKPDAEKLSPFECGFEPLKMRESSLTFAIIFWPFFSFSSISKLHFFSVGDHSERDCCQ